MLPEQVWDSADIPRRELYKGRPTGSAMPLVWAHAEYLKLRRSLAEGRVFDMPAQTVKRYLVEKRRSSFSLWRPNQKCRSIRAGTALRVELLQDAAVRWTSDGWTHAATVVTRSTGWGVHVADLPTGTLAEGTVVQFTIKADTAEVPPAGQEFSVRVGR